MVSQAIFFTISFFVVVVCYERRKEKKRCGEGGRSSIDTYDLYYLNFHFHSAACTWHVLQTDQIHLSVIRITVCVCHQLFACERDSYNHNRSRMPIFTGCAYFHDTAMPVRTQAENRWSCPNTILDKTVKRRLKRRSRVRELIPLLGWNCVGNLRADHFELSNATVQLMFFAVLVLPS